MIRLEIEWLLPGWFGLSLRQWLLGCGSTVYRSPKFTNWLGWVRILGLSVHATIEVRRP